MIKVEHLTKYYGGFLAVDDLSFTIEEGHVYGFLGPNGAGKSTTMNILTGCLSATSGRVEIGGHDIFEEPGEFLLYIAFRFAHQLRPGTSSPGLPSLYCGCLLTALSPFLLFEAPSEARPSPAPSSLEPSPVPYLQP